MPTAAHVLQHNKKAWEREVQNGNPWTIPVSSEQISRARQGDFQLVLTPLRPIPPEWYPPLPGYHVLHPAGGGGQLAAGFHLIDFYEDISPEDKLSAFMPLFITTRALKPERSFICNSCL